MAYIYRHIRNDKNEPFYIGVGSDKRYHRAKTKTYRNKYWKNIVNKTSYEIEIIIDDLSTEEAHKKEIEFIKLYGRRDLGLGTLVNMTDGGEGMTNVSPETKYKLSNDRKGINNPFYNKSITKEHRIKLNTGKDQYWRNYRKSLNLSSDVKIGRKGFMNLFKKENQLKKIVINLDTGIFYSSVKEASNETDYTYSVF